MYCACVEKKDAKLYKPMIVCTFVPAYSEQVLYRSSNKAGTEQEQGINGV